MLKYKISFVGSSGARGSQFGWLNYTDVKNGNLGGKGGVDYWTIVTGNWRKNVL